MVQEAVVFGHQIPFDVAFHQLVLRISEQLVVLVVKVSQRLCRFADILRQTLEVDHRLYKRVDLVEFDP